MLKKIFNYRNVTILMTIELLMIIFHVGFFLQRGSGPSMEPTLNRFFNLNLCERLPSTLEDLEHGDIVVFKNNKNGHDICKRLIGLPGDHIIVDGDTIIRNGEVLEEPYVKYPADLNYQWNLTLDEDEYFIIGDNRSNSGDSRIYGPFKASDFIAKVIWHT